ncbi:MAG TPA: zf-HC2 domain-containing protein [Thermodesulfobacteriota bacterium]|nr:zf-HC2 domain-containing protein [Thermodesulfobacteriota bacterium]
MDCEKIRDRFSSLWEKGLSPSEEKTLKEHLSSCPECLGEFEQFEKTMRWLQSVGEVEVPEGFLSELYKKREEKQGAIPSEKSRGRGFHFPLFFKLPAQAVAMVAIVFLVLYLTKMMPMEGGRLMEKRQTSSPLSVQEKPEQVLTPPAAPPRPESFDRLKTPSPIEGLESKASPIPGGEAEKRRSELTPAEPSPSGRGVEGLIKKKGELRNLEAYREASSLKEPEQVKLPAPGEKKKEEAYAPETPPPKAGAMAYQQMKSKREGRAEAPSPEPGKKREELALREKSLVASKPAQEIVLKISDRKGVVPRLHELVMQFGGEVVATEGNSFVASLPTGSFSKFKKELAGFSSSGEADRLIAKKDETGSLRLDEGAKREEGDEKSKGSASPTADTKSRTIVRILLVDE